MEARITVYFSVDLDDILQNIPEDEHYAKIEEITRDLESGDYFSNSISDDISGLYHENVEVEIIE